MRLAGKVAVVTGGTSGIGQVSAVALAREGAAVMVAGRREAEGQQVVAEIHAAGGKAAFVRTNVAQEADVERLIAETLRLFGRLDIAFNNAGVEHAGSLTDLTIDDYRHVFDINVLGVMLSQKYEVPAMRRTGGGSIINTSSILGHIGMPGVSIYTASKFAVEGLTRVAALELVGENIRVNAIAPGGIETAMIDRFAGEPGSDNRNQLAAMHPVGRLGRPEEIAAAVVFLASDEASFITGTSLPVDGGFLAR